MAAFDADVVDEVLQEPLLGGGLAVFDGLGEVIADGIEGGPLRLGGVGGSDQFDQFRSAGVQLGGLGAEGPDALAALGLGQGAGFEGVQVALDGLLGPGCLGVDDGELALVLGAHRSGAFGSGGQCGFEQVGSGVGVEQGVEDCGVEGVGGEAFRVAGVGAVALAGEAGVVAVPVAVAVSGGADETLAAVGAGEQPGEEVVAPVGGPVRVVLAARMRWARSKVSTSTRGRCGAGCPPLQTRAGKTRAVPRRRYRRASARHRRWESGE